MEMWFPLMLIGLPEEFLPEVCTGTGIPPVPMPARVHGRPWTGKYTAMGRAGQNVVNTMPTGSHGQALEKILWAAAGMDKAGRHFKPQRSRRLLEHSIHAA